MRRRLGLAAAVALFRPVRDRILDDFAARLRDEVEREAVECNLHDTVRIALAPAGVTLWAPRRSP